MPDDRPPLIQSDDDWKAQAAREKEELQQSAREKAEKEPVGPMPEASFTSLVAGLRAQGLIALGLIEDPLTGQARPDRDQAKYLIDTLGILDAKTAGHLTAEEKAFLDAALYELRMNFLRM